MEPLTALQRAACADLAVKIAARMPSPDATAFRCEFLAGLDRIAIEGVPLSVATAADDDAELIARRIANSDAPSR